MLCFSGAPARSLAQDRLFTIGLGYGNGVFAHAAPNDATGLNALIFIQLKPPVVPAIRFELVGTHGDGIDHDVSLVQPFLSTPITPYVIGGLGRYGLRYDEREGWNAGVGARYLFCTAANSCYFRGLFVELRRHQRLDHDLLTFGVTR